MSYGNVRPDYFTAGWRGQLPLLGIFTPDLVSAAIIVIPFVLASFVFMLFWPFCLIVIAWFVVALWQCAFNTVWPPSGYFIRGGLILIAAWLIWS